LRNEAANIYSVWRGMLGWWVNKGEGFLLEALVVASKYSPGIFLEGLLYRRCPDRNSNRGPVEYEYGVNTTQTTSVKMH
jgi:hypothetical protein